MLDAAPVTVRRLRPVPSSSAILVTEGQSVTPSTPVARTETLPGKLWRIDVGGELRTSKPRALDRLVLSPSDRTIPGGIVAVGGTFFSRRAVRSPVKGVLSLVSRTRGLAYVREDVEVGADNSPVEVPVAKTLGIPGLAIMVYKAAEANMGSVVVKGQELGRFGKRRCISPLYGTITGISPARGSITVSPLFKSLNITAYIKGSVERVVSGEGVEVVGRAAVFSGAWGLGGESNGSVRVIDGDLTEDCTIAEGSVVVASGTATLNGLSSAAEAGARGAVVGWMSTGTAMAFAGRIKNMGITGDEMVPFPLILTQGFLPEPMPPELVEALTKYEGFQCSLTGATHIRAGVIRPEILVFPEWDERT